MIECLLCGKEARSWQGLAKHLRSAHQMSVYDYHRTSEAAMAQLRARIVENVEHVDAPYGLETPCWRWKGRLTCGYGSLRLAGSPTETSHRLSWWAHHGDPLSNPPPAEDVVLMHQCDFKACANPDHLVPGDHTANMEERRERGRHLLCHASDLEEAQVHEIRYLAMYGESYRVIGEKFGRSASAIGHIVAGRSFGHIITPPPSPDDPVPF